MYGAVKTQRFQAPVGLSLTGTALLLQGPYIVWSQMSPLLFAFLLLRKLIYSSIYLNKEIHNHVQT